jgi:hypothetical protein
MKSILSGLLLLSSLAIIAQDAKTRDRERNDKFRQMYDLLATPNMYRTASGAPGPEYYQQQADYKIDIELDDKNTKLYGSETITYHNNAKESLDYLWIQLDQNEKARTSKSALIRDEKASGSVGVNDFSRKYLEEKFDGGFRLDYVKDVTGKPMKYTVNETMMRIELDKPLAHGEQISLSIKWWYNINIYLVVGGRSGY